MFTYCLKMITQSLEDMRRQKLRCVLTMSGITWGTLAVILLMAFGGSLRGAALKAMSGMGENIVLVSGSRTTMPYEGFPAGIPVRLKPDTAEMLRASIPEIGSISPEIDRNYTLEYHGNRQQFNVFGVIPEYGSLRNLQPEEGGRFLDQLDMESRRRVVFLGDVVRDKLFGAGVSAVGETVMLSGSPYVVIGVLKHKVQNNSYMTQDENIVFIPFTTCLDMSGVTSINRIIVRARTFDETPLMNERIRNMLAAQAGFSPDDTEALSVWDTAETTEFLNGFFIGFEAFLVVSGVFTLIVGGIGVANIMYVSIRERRREIGIKSALGATPGLIQLQFLLEAFVLMAIGGGIGVLTALMIVSAIRMPSLAGLHTMIGRPQIDVTTALVTVSVLALIGLAAGWSPARQAAEMDPVRALEY